LAGYKLLHIAPYVYYRSATIPLKTIRGKEIIKINGEGKNMKKKIVGIVVLMLVATTVVSATNINVKEKIQPTSSSVDVPVWVKGDSWTYNYHEIIYKYRANGTLWYTCYYNDTETSTVTNDTGDSYTVKVNSTNNEGRATIGSIRLKFTRFTKSSGELVVRKTDLAGLRESDQEKGFAFLLIGKIGLPIPTQYMHFSEWNYTPAWVNLPFPMTAGTNGTFPGFSFTVQEKCYLYWGLFKLFDWPAESYTDLPIGYNCEMANITTPAGTFNAYNVSVESTYGLGHYSCWRYYLPDVGNLAKIYFNNDWDETGKPGTIFESELVSTTYTP
jgi:hypothetical protein